MKENRKKTYYILWTLIILSLLGSVYLTAVIYYPPDDERPVTVFVLDTAGGRAGEMQAHGESVSRVIMSEYPAADINFLEVGAGGRPELELYLAALRRIIQYRADNPEARILVNVSMAFMEGENQRYLMSRLLDLEVMVIAAAGNNNSERAVYPAGFSGVIAVASAGPRGKDEFSNYGSYIDLAAPGQVSHSRMLYYLGQYIWQGIERAGTSFAAPRVTGLMSFLLAHRPDLEGEQILSIIKNTAVPINDDLFTGGQLGAGLINSRQALREARPDLYYLSVLRYLLYGLFVVSSAVLIKFKYGYFLILVLLLMMLVVIPGVLFLERRLLFYVTRELNPGRDILLFSVLTAVLSLTGWEKKYLLKIYGLFLLVFLIGGELINYNIYLFILPGTILIFAEWIKLYTLNKTDDYRVLIQSLKSRSRKIKQLVKRKLADLSPAQRANLLAFCSKNSSRAELCIQKLLPLYKDEKDKVIPVLKKFLESDKSRLVDFGGRCFKKLPGQNTGGYVVEMLQKNRGDQLMIMEILEELARQDKISSSDRITAENILLDYIKQSSNMWLRHQAVRTLVAVKKEHSELLSLLEELSRDEQHLVHLEAEYYLRELQKN